MNSIIDRGDPSSIVIAQGRQWSILFQWVDATGEPVDFSAVSVSASAQIRQWPVDGPLLAEMTFAIVDAAVGLFELSLTSTQTGAMKRSGRWDLKVSVGGGDPIALITDSPATLLSKVTA